MFTGIIQAKGVLLRKEPKGGDVSLHIDTGDLDLSDVNFGDSIATNGVCLTVIQLGSNSFIADVSKETMRLTTLNELSTGSSLNLEKALTLQTPLGGHLVSGHVDGIGVVQQRYDDGRSVKFHIDAPDTLAKYIAHKGSICVNGVSLTVNAVNGSEFELNLVPHSLENTTMLDLQVGDWVNLEVDVIARYLERLMMGDKAAEFEKTTNIDMDMLARTGFLR